MQHGAVARPDTLSHAATQSARASLTLTPTNFYCGQRRASIHGHHWMVGTIPNEYVEVNSAEGGLPSPFPPPPGRRYPGSTGGMDPEDYNEIGELWGKHGPSPRVLL